MTEIDIVLKIVLLVSIGYTITNGLNVWKK